MKFDKQQLEKWIDTELGFIRYYGYREDRYSLTESSDIYNEVRSIGYAKRTMTLSDRCSPVSIGSDTPITTQSKIEDLYVTYTRNKENSFSPCEIFIKLFPERKMEIINIIKNQEPNSPTRINI